MKQKKLLLVILLLLGIGFAAVSTTLYLNGNVNIATNNDDFDVIFTKAVLDGADISSTAITESGKKITFETKDLINVGDISKLDFEVTNNSSIYDAEVSIECTAKGAKKSYYEITKEVATPIVAKTKGVGKVEVKLLKASVEDFSETFTCTLKVIAKERTSKAAEPTYYAFGDPSEDGTATTEYTSLTYPGTDTPAKLFIKSESGGSQKSVCIIKNENKECFKNNNYAAEVERLKNVFGEANCTLGESSTSCTADGLYCDLSSAGRVTCDDREADVRCIVYQSGLAICAD